MINALLNLEEKKYSIPISIIILSIIYDYGDSLLLLLLLSLPFETITAVAVGEAKLIIEVLDSIVFVVEWFCCFCCVLIIILLAIEEEAEAEEAKISDVCICLCVYKCTVFCLFVGMKKMAKGKRNNNKQTIIKWLKTTKTNQTLS